MNNFHVYEAIGRGKHSTVYKGRKKKTLEYYAIKSVDKSQRGKVLQELFRSLQMKDLCSSPSRVRALNSLDHPNILKFFFCYETSAHLWLVLEYCVGGDLMTLLRQDSRLPEDSIHDLARDLVKALQFLHSKGIIYSDLKPSNILLDENGRMKLCDFGLARSIAEISKNSLSMLPQAKRGTPCYMAPELFQEGGVHSYASDFWALGCILYECYAGRPPFLGNEFTQLVKSILSDPMPPLLDNPSCSFLNLVKQLLAKDPSERIQWPELCGHSFWRSKFTPVTLHPQPDFSNMLQLYIKPHSSECNTDRSAQQRTPSKLREREPTGVQKQDENCLTSAVNNSTPTKTAQSGRKTSAKNIVKVDDKKRDTSNAAKVVNVLRLSRIAKQNLQRENDKENYRRPFPKNYENNVEVNIQNNDMELDFSENPEDDTPDESDSACVHDEKISIQSENDEKTEDDELNMNISEMKLENNVPIPNDVKGCEPDLLSDNKPATPPSVSPHRNAQCHKAGPCKTPDSTVTNSVNDLLEALWHQSDLLVKPVMPSRKCDKASEATPMLPFDASTPYDYAKLQPKHLEALNSRIIHTLSGTAPLSEKQNTIKYLEMICMNTDAANILVNGPIMPLLVKMLRLSKTPSLRALLASLIGLMVRHSTSIKPDLAASGLINVLMDGLRDKQDKVRRFCMAAMGELLFYISTQNDHNDVDSLASPLKDNRSVSNWQVPSSVITLVSSILRKGEDDIAQLYALRTIENICSQGVDWTSRFTNQNMIGNLCYISKAMGKQESTRLTAGSCLVRLARFSPSCITLIFDKFSFKDTASSLVKGSSREQQICLNLLSMALVGGQTVPNFSRQLSSLVEEKQLVPSLVSLIEQGTEVLKGKTLIFIALLCKNSRRWLPHFFCNSKFLLAVDRLMKEKDSFIQHSMKAFVELVATTVPGILETVRGDIQQMMLGKRHGHISSLTGRSNLKCTVHLFSVVLHLLGSSIFKSRVATNQVLSQLAVIIKLIESPFQGRDEFQITLLQILESISEDAPLVLQDPIIFSSRLLPSLAILYRGNKDGDARFLCLKILFDVMVVFFNDGPIEVKEAVKEDLKSISDIHFLHLYPAFIEDEDPIPMYAQKLLLMLIEFNYVKVSAILNLKTVSRCFDFLLGDLSSANVNSVKLCLALASDPEMEGRSLSQLKVVRKIGNLLEFVAAKEMEDLLEPTLSLCKAFILQSVGIHKGIMYSNEPALLLDTTMDMQIAIEQNRSVKDISDFSSNIGVFFELIGHTEQYVADLASECVVLLFKAAPRESTMGFLTNLSKLSSVFQSLHDRVSGLVLLRLLYSLAISVRQYLSQAMILSISVSDVRRIESIVSSLKTSGKTDVANAASLLCLELQRLPRCV